MEQIGKLATTVTKYLVQLLGMIGQFMEPVLAVAQDNMDLVYASFGGLILGTCIGLILVLVYRTVHKAKQTQKTYGFSKFHVSRFKAKRLSSNVSKMQGGAKEDQAAKDFK